jgi:hypothetical protein
MLGTSIVATIVNRRYETGVADALQVLGEPVASRWLPRLADPRILIDPALRDTLLADLNRAGLAGSALIEAARQTLVQSIHLGVALTGIAALAAALTVRRIAHITFSRRAGK